MTNPVVLITGALTGIGRATAIAFAKEGARLVVSGRREAEGKALAAELGKRGAEAEFRTADVRHEQEGEDLVAYTVKRFGRLDIAVNNAGTEGKPGPVTEQTPETYAASFDTNVLGTLRGMKREPKAMQAQGSGSAVMVPMPVTHMPPDGQYPIKSTLVSVTCCMTRCVLERCHAVYCSG